jgi:sterol desaturase/sphingolipid hydroxylase (fatty acid hydroxylase superfamily)
MVAILLTILFTYLFTSLFGYVVHWSLHQNWTGKLNEKHMTHHLKLYPPSDYTSEEYRRAGKDNTVVTFAIASVPVVLAPLTLWLLGVFTLGMMIAALLVMAFMGFSHDYLHDAFHIKNHFLSRWSLTKDIFKRWVDLHYLHHVDMGKNYGIFVFHWDRILGTFWRDSAKTPRA